MNLLSLENEENYSLNIINKFKKKKEYESLLITIYNNIKYRETFYLKNIRIEQWENE